MSFIIFFAGAQLLIATVHKFIDGNVVKPPTLLAIYVTVISIAGKLLLVTAPVQGREKNRKFNAGGKWKEHAK